MIISNFMKIARNKKYTFCFDIDNTICKTIKSNYKNSKPDKQAIETINLLYNKGHTIKIYTARYMGRSNDNYINAKKIGLKKTKEQLKKWNVKYHKLFFSKPSSDIYIDDKSYGYNKNWRKKFLRLI